MSHGLPASHAEIINLPDGEYPHTDYFDIKLVISGDKLGWYKDDEFLANYEQVSYYQLPHFLERLKRSSLELALSTSQAVIASEEQLLSQISSTEIEFDRYGEKMADIADMLLNQSQVLLKNNRGIEAQEIIHKDIEMAVKLLDYAHRKHSRRKKLKN